MSQPQRRGSPVFILNEGSERTQGKDAQSSNIAAGKAVAESVRTTLGPKGMDKMLVGSAGDVVITNDGVTILNEMDIEHPAAQILVEVAESQETKIGDGTTTAAVLAGQLLARAEELLEQDVHPRTIVEGYAAAREIAQDALEDLLVGDAEEAEQLVGVARSSMTGKGTGDLDAETLAELIVEAVRHVRQENGVAREDVRVHTQKGAASSATELVEGVIGDDEPIRDDMPRSVESPTIAVLDAALEKRETSIDAEYNIESTGQLDAALASEDEELRGYADAVADAGVDVLISTEDIDERAGAYLAEHGILAFEDVGGLSDDRAGAIARATGATKLGSVEAIESADLGEADRVRTEQYADDALLFVEGGAAAEAVTLFVRGGTTHVSDELERAVEDSIDVVVAALDEGGVVPGAGTSEVVLASEIREAAAGVEGRKQLAVEAFADALEVLPRTLAENMGMDQIDALVDLRAANESGRAGVIATGETGAIEDPLEYGVLDPAAVKREALQNATESATMIARIDDVISAE